MNIKSFMENYNLPYHVKAVGFGFCYIAIAFVSLFILGFVLNIIVDVFGLQSIFFLIAFCLMYMFAWMVGDMYMTNKKWDDERKSRQ